MMERENVIRAFSADHVVRLTGLTKRQLASWDATGFFKPQYAFDDRRSPHSRIYSFQDVVGLRIISILRRKYKISLQQLRKVAAELSEKNYAFWVQMTLYVVNGEVSFEEPETGQVRSVVGKQFVVDIPLERVIGDVTGEVKRLQRRGVDKIGRIERHRLVAHNADVIAGTRIPTAAIRRFKEAGYTIDEILREYPSLKKRDISAALAHERKRNKAA